jgi:uncharacterized protein YwqG
MEPKNMMNIDLPPELANFRSQIEATVKPYVKIKTQLTRQTRLTQSKFFGFPYLPKDFPYPTTAEGNCLHLLAQINFEEVPFLEPFPSKGILQFYIAADGCYGFDHEHPTSQTNFRVLYFHNSDLDESQIMTNFDFLRTIWTYGNHFLPFWVCDSYYTPHRNDCFALSFSPNSGPITALDYKFDELIGSGIWDIPMGNGDNLWSTYGERFGSGHRLGGNPNFCQRDPRAFIPREEEEYILLLQIDTDGDALNKIYVEWSALGVCNFFIKISDLIKLDFSNILYNWDC